MSPFAVLSLSPFGVITLALTTVRRTLYTIWCVKFLTARFASCLLLTVLACVASCKALDGSRRFAPLLANPRPFQRLLKTRTF